MYLLIFKKKKNWGEGYSLPTLSQRMPPSLLLVMATHVHGFKTWTGLYGPIGLTRTSH